jgi:hypothetical protein
MSPSGVKLVTWVPNATMEGENFGTYGLAESTLQKATHTIFRELCIYSLLLYRMKLNEERAILLEEEKIQISEHADELKASIKDLIEQKKITEAELREEVIARLETEKRLHNAEHSLMNLDRKLNKKGTKYSQNDKDEMLGNVCHLKSKWSWTSRFTEI